MSDTRSESCDSTDRLRVARTPSEAPRRPSLAAGDAFGRYTVRGRLGKGGMGEVWAAHDPHLDRLVALKVLRRDVGGGSAEARARFQREAQAMARLNHPNVVSIYEVGTHGAHVFVAMELVEGPTLSAWLAEPRPWREVVGVFLQAGRGLAAAHEAGIVHRDFKPSNVLLGDRVRVADFGLARAAGEAIPCAPPPSSILATELTVTGHLLGTPAYMAPEQRLAQSVSPLSDQYSFGLALREALAPCKNVPSWLRAVYARALQISPDRRYPSMMALLAELGRDPDRARKQLVAGAALLGVAAAAVVASSTLVASPPCAVVGAGLWDGAARAKVKAAFAATGRPYAADTFDRVDGLVEDRLSRWAEARRQTCLATHVRHEQSEALLDLRMRCLGRARDDAATTLGLLAEADGPSVDRAVAAVAELADPSPCADTEALTALVPPPREPERLIAEAAVRAETGRVLALTNLGRMKEGVAAAHALVPRAQALGITASRAAALRAATLVEVDGGDPAQAVAFAQAGIRAAEEAHDDATRADLLTLLTFVLGNKQHRFAEAETLAAVAEAAVARTGAPAALMASYHHRTGSVMLVKGDALGALPRFVAELGFAIRAAGWSSRAVALALSDLAGAEENLDAFAATQTTLEASIGVLESLFGREHPWVATSLQNLGNVAYLRSDFDAAAAAFSRALAVNERAVGASSPKVANNLAGLARARGAQGRTDDGMALAERAAAILPPGSPALAVNLDIRAELALKSGHFERASAFAAEALAIHEKVNGKDHSDTGGTHVLLAEALRERGALADAQLHAERAVAILSAVRGPHSADSLLARIALARVLAEAKQGARAAELCDQALPMQTRILGPENEDAVASLVTCAEVALRAGRGGALAEDADRAAAKRGNPELAARARAAHARALFATDRTRACALAGEAVAIAASRPWLLRRLAVPGCSIVSP